MTTLTESDYQEWFTKTFGSGYEIWHDGLNTAAVTGLAGELRSLAIQMLFFGVSTGYGYAAQALSAMGETSALSGLRAKLSSTSGEDRIRFAEAIHHLSPSENEDGNSESDKLAKELIGVLETPGLHWGVKLKAAISLRKLKDAESESALLAAVERNEDYLVKYHACESLLIRWDIAQKHISAHPEIFSMIRTPREGDVLQDNEARGAEAGRLMRQLKP